MLCLPSVFCDMDADAAAMQPQARDLKGNIMKAGRAAGWSRGARGSWVRPGLHGESEFLSPFSLLLVDSSAVVSCLWVHLSAGSGPSNACQSAATSLLDLFRCSWP